MTKHPHRHAPHEKPPQSYSWLKLVEQGALAAELFLIALCVFAYYLTTKSYESGFSLMQVAGTTLTVLYLLLPILLFRSHGRRQHLLSHFFGFAAAMAVLAMMFNVEGWEARSEMGIVAAGLCLLAGAVGIILYLVSKNHPQRQQFLLGALVRVAIGALLTAPALQVVFEPK